MVTVDIGLNNSRVHIFIIVLIIMTVTDIHLGIRMIIFRRRGRASGKDSVLLSHNASQVTRSSDKLYYVYDCLVSHHNSSHHGGLSPLLLPYVRGRPGRLCYAANGVFQTKEQRIRTPSGGRYGWQFRRIRRDCRLPASPRALTWNRWHDIQQAEEDEGRALDVARSVYEVVSHCTMSLFTQH